MPRLKVLFITTWYPTKENPVSGIFVREHAKAVRLYDDVVVLHLMGEDPKLKGFWRIEREVDETFTENIPTFRVWSRHFPIIKARYFYGILKSFPYIISKGFRPDIIHSHIYVTGISSVLVGKLYRIPVVITEHSTEFPRKLLRSRDVWKSRFAFNRANMVFPVSNSLQRAMEEYGIEARFQVIPNVVDTNLFYPDSSDRLKSPTKRLLTVALLDSSHKKGIPLLLNALAYLTSKRDDWRLNILGDGPARTEYQRLTVDLGLANKVTFHGLKSKPEVAEFMRQSDLLVVPSLFETFSVVTAEALAAGIPVLATNCGGPEEFVTNDVGLLVPPGSVDALVGGLDYMLNHLERFKPDETSCYAAEHFSYAGVGEQLHENYLECITKYKGLHGTATKAGTS